MPHFNPVQRIRQAFGHHESPLQISEPTFVRGSAHNAPAPRVVPTRSLPPLPQPNARGLYSPQVIAWLRKGNWGERCHIRLELLTDDCRVIDYDFVKQSDGTSLMLLITTTRNVSGKRQIAMVHVDTWKSPGVKEPGRLIALYTRSELGCAALQFEQWLADTFNASNKNADVGKASNKAAVDKASNKNAAHPGHSK